MASSKSYSVWWNIFAISLCALPFVIFLCSAGNKSGEEFSPDDFTRRRFSYNKMPWLGFVISGIKYEDATSVFASDLVSSGLITVPNNGKKTWHLISDNASDQSLPDFDAKYLSRYLDLVDKNNLSIWFEFNDKFPKLATEFWPIVADLAREKLYLDVSDLLLRAMSLDARDLNKFRLFMNKNAIKAFDRILSEATDEKDQQSAVRILTRIIAIEPSKERYLARAHAYQKLGDAEKYHADIENAKK